MGVSCSLARRLAPLRDGVPARAEDLVRRARRQTRRDPEVQVRTAKGRCLDPWGKPACNRRAALRTSHYSKVGRSEVLAWHRKARITAVGILFEVSDKP
jgi:hypothetical protein